MSSRAWSRCPAAAGTPASREAARQRAVQQEGRRQAKAVQRAEHREVLAQQRAQRKQELAVQRRIERKEAAEQHAEQMAHIHQRNEQRWERVRQTRAERSRRRRARGWPATGLMIAGAATLFGVILAGVASPCNSLGAVAGGIIVLGVLAAVVCGAAALWRRLRRGREDVEHANEGANNDSGRAWMGVDQVADGCR